MLLLPLVVSGCAQGAQLDLAIRAAAEGETVLAEIDDYETARLATVSRLERLEELARIAPAQPAVRGLLTIGWARHALLFVEDDLEEAKERADTPGASYHALRARNAFERAVHHGREYLGGAAFDAAVAGEVMPAWLAGRVGDDPAVLLWMGAAWLGRLRVASEDRRQLSSQARVGEDLIERSLALAPSAQLGWGHALLGLWHGRAGGDAERAHQDFDRASEIGGRKLLMTQLFQARTIVCLAHDRERWDALFKEILDARDPAPEVRIDNAAAKRRAARDAQGTRRAQCVP